MATPKQLAANRENAKHPRTLSEETKQSLRTRALTHGLTATHEANTVLRVENKAEFDQTLKALQSEATLGTAQEFALVQLQAESYWKLRRANRMESAALDASLVAEQLKGAVSQNLDPENLGAPLALALREEAKWFDNLRRYTTASERAFYRATRELAMLRKVGYQQPIGESPKEHEAAQPEIRSVSQSTESQETKQPPQPIHTSTPEIGYVSQTSPHRKAPAVSGEERDRIATDEALEIIDHRYLESARRRIRPCDTIDTSRSTA